MVPKIGISIHALLAESDHKRQMCCEFGNVISIHALLAESDPGAKSTTPERYYFYPRSPCGERREESQTVCKAFRISIHALLAESDGITRVKRLLPSWISIHALLAESDFLWADISFKCVEFLSTLSLRRATQRKPSQLQPQHIFLSTLSLRRATPLKAGQTYYCEFLSTLSLRRATQIPHLGRNPAPRFLSTLSLRRATRHNSLPPLAILFLSTLSLRRATHGVGIAKINFAFLSTLSLRRATALRSPRIALMVDFYPRSPCGERLSLARYHAVGVLFLSTLSLRRATTRQRKSFYICAISIHALLAESDPLTEQTPPPFWISIHALLAESDLTEINKMATGQISIHALLAESDIFALSMAVNHLLFLSTLSLRRATHFPGPDLVGDSQFLSTLSLRRATPQTADSTAYTRFLSTLSLRRATITMAP